MHDIEIDRSRLKSTYKTLRFATLRTTVALMLREMSSTYGRSVGGYLWAILEPVGGIVAITMIFSIFLKTPPLGTNFALFYATGILPFLIFTSINGKLSMALNYNRQLLAYPRVTIVDALLARLILNALTQLAVSAIVLSGLLFFFDTGSTLVLDPILEAHLLTIALAAGWGILNCLLTSIFPLWQSVWSILTRPLVLMSGVVFIFNSIPLPYRDWLWFNPLIHVIGIMRSGFYPGYDATYASSGYVWLLSLLPAVIGLFFLRRYYRDFRI